MSKKASIIFGIIITAIIGLWLWTIFIPKNYISIGGSTSVDPVMQRLTNRYSKDYKNETNFIYSSSGSRGGLSNMESGIYDIGFISRDISSDLKDRIVESDDGPSISSNNSQSQNSEIIYNYLLKKQEENNKLNYLQIGIDAVVLTYYPTPEFAKYYANKFIINPKKVEDQKLIFDIYQRKISWVDLAIYLTKESESEVSQKLRAPENYRKVIPYSRETGSGTRNSFEKLFNFQNFSDSSTPPSKSIENNSNGMMFTGIQSAINSVGYLSLNYLRSIKEDNNLKTVIINDGQTTFDPLDNNNFDENGEVVLENFETYPLTRPYIGLFKTDLSIKKLESFAKFFAWMGEALKTNELTIPRRIYQIEGLIPKLSFNFNLQTKK